MEQQPPCAQFPQTVFPLFEPHVPSVVTAPVGGAVVGEPRIGSACDDEAVGGVVAVAEAEAAPPPVVQPLWHPCATSQLIHGESSLKITIHPTYCAAVFPHQLSPTTN